MRKKQVNMTINKQHKNKTYDKYLK